MPTPTRRFLFLSLIPSAILGLAPLELNALAEPPAAADPQTAPAPSTTANAAEEKSSDDWIRLRRSKSRELRLQVATREYKPAAGAAGPAIAFVSAVHIADKAFYDDLQKQLDATDLVLFEGVGPPGLGTNKLRKESSKAGRTRHRLTIIGEMIEAAREKQSKDAANNNNNAAEAKAAYPASIDAAVKLFADSPTKQHWIKIARQDGWGNQLVYTPADNGTDYTLKSLGRDGAPGGEGWDADISVDKAELGDRRDEGIQAKLADTFGLTFQLNGISTDRPNWMNSDMGADEVARRLGGDPNAEPDEGDDQSMSILAMLDPNSMMSKMATGLLGFIKMMPGGADRAKLMMMLMLPHAEDMLGGTKDGGGGGGGGLGASRVGEMMDLGKTMQVIIHDRNEVVINDLKKLIESFDAAKPGSRENPKTIAVFYGGGHMTDLECRLLSEFGYERSKETWSNAIRLDLNEAKITDEEVRSLGRMLKQQMEMMKGMSR